MQYILTQEEYDNLEPKEHYEALSASVNDVFKELVKEFCPRITNNKKYCDGCGFLKARIKERYSRKRVCPLSIECSK